MIEPGKVVGVEIGAGSARPGLVLAVGRKNDGDAEPILDVLITYESESGVVTAGQLNHVPYAGDQPDAHWRWKYSGPEVLVRRPADDPAGVTTPDLNQINASAGAPTSTPVDVTQQ